MIAQKANIENDSNPQTKKTVLDYDTIFNKAPIGLEYYDKDGILVDINEIALRNYGCTDKERLLKKGICLYDHPSYKSQMKNETDRYHACTCSLNYDFDSLKKDSYYPGSKRSGKARMQNKIKPIINEKGEIEGTIVSTLEITEDADPKYEQLYREKKIITEALPIGLAIYDKDGYQQFINPALASIFGVEDSEAHLAKHINLFEDPIISERLKEKIRHNDIAEASIEYSLRTVSQTNYFDTGLPETTKYLNCKTRKIKDESGKVQAIMLLVSDVTNYERKNQELQEAYQKLSLALDAGDMTAWMFDIHKKMYHTILGNALAGAGISQEDNLEMLHPDDRQMQQELFSSITRGEKKKGIAIFRYLSEDGQYRYYESQIIPKRKNGKVTHLIGTQKDVTEWHKLAEKLERTNRQNTLILNNINSGLVYISADYKVIWENVSFIFPEQSNGKRYYEAGKLCYKSAKDADYPCQGCAMMRAMESKCVEHAEYSILGKTIEIHANPILNEQNEVEGVILRIDDITQRKQIQNELETTRNEALASNEQLKQARDKAEQSDKLKSAFLANMSHEIRTPLNAIVGFSELLHNTTNKKESAEYWRIISTNNNLLLTLIGDILDLSKIEAGYVDLTNREFDITQLFEEMATLYKQKMNDNVTFHHKVPYQSYIVNLDKNRLTQILTNFVNNAIKFTQEGSIEIGYTICNNSLRIYCSDTGIGISKENAAKVFGRFEKLNDFAQGTGLGLSICKAIVDAQGGRIGVNSKINEGSTFWAELPIK